MLHMGKRRINDYIVSDKIICHSLYICSDKLKNMSVPSSDWKNLRADNEDLRYLKTKIFS